MQCPQCASTDPFISEDTNFRCYQCGCLFSSQGTVQREDSTDDSREKQKRLRKT